MPKAKDLTGMKFGRLTALEPTDERKHRKIVWKCSCICGNISFVPSNYLLSGNTKSCGCLNYEKSMQRLKAQQLANITHHGRDSRLYHTWVSMKQRCYNSKRPEYKNYGGRGISVCEQWRHDYAAFKQWSYENGYDENASRGACTLDRINPNGNYEPSNCRWVDMKTQNNNRRNSKKSKS